MTVTLLPLKRKEKRRSDMDSLARIHIVNVSLSSHSRRRDGGEIEPRQVHLRFAVFAVESADYRVPDFSLAPCEAALILGEVEVYLVYIARAVS